MRREIRRRLEKALITLQEPNGSTIRSIIKVINKEAPILSLRKVLEALQEGINEGFLCMYNGRFKLKQQIPKGKSFREEKDIFGSEGCFAEEKDSENIPSTLEDELFDDDSEFDFKKERQRPAGGKGMFTMKREKGKKIHFEKLNKRKKNASHATPSKNRSTSEVKDKKKRRATKTNMKTRCTYKTKGKAKKRSKKFNSIASAQESIDSSSTVEQLTTSYGVPQRSAADKPDLKRQRGPRCTSMKKDIRMPSKVQIPFMVPPGPQKCSSFNEFLRGSPKPVNGPLFGDYNNFPLKPDKLEFFHC